MKRHLITILLLLTASVVIAKGLKDVGYTYINIDDGFFGYRDADGLMHAHPTRFHSGMKAMADYIHALGLKAGIYSDAGVVTCGSIWDKDKAGIGAGLYGHEEQDARLYFRDWGYDFIKIDYCGAGQELDLNERKKEVRYAENASASGGMVVTMVGGSRENSIELTCATMWLPDIDKLTLKKK